MPDLFDGATTPVDDNDTDKVTFDTLVGEGKKYRDPDAAAKAIVEKDRFIEQLKTENAGLRQVSEQSLRMEEFLDKLNSNHQSAPPATSEPPADKTGLTEKDVEQLLARQLTEFERKTLYQKNLDEVRNELIKRFGQNYQTKLKELTSNLGVGEQFMNALAAEQPKAFMRLIGEQPKSEPLVTPPGSSSQFTSAPASGPRRRSFYNEIRKKNPSEYYSVRVQQQMFKDIEAQGEAFLD